MVLLPSASARSWAKVKLAKHLFEHRYDYRTEWLRFTDTLGRSGTDAPPLGERVIKAFADIVDAPGGLLLVERCGRRDHDRRVVELAGPQPARRRARDAPAISGPTSRARGRILELDAYRQRLGPSARTCVHRVPALDRRGRLRLGRRAADPQRPAVRPRPARRARLPPRRSTGRISTCCAPPAARRRARWPKRTARKRCRTRSGSRNSTAASPSSSTTSRTSSANCRCCRATPSATPTIPNSAPT